LKTWVLTEDVLDGFVKCTTGEVKDMTTESRGHSFGEVTNWSPESAFMGLENAFVEYRSTTEFNDQGRGVIRVELESNSIEIVERNHTAKKRTHVEYLPKDGSFLVTELCDKIATTLTLRLPKTNVES
jgi:hypothetical protein